MLPATEDDATGKLFGADMVLLLKTLGGLVLMVGRKRSVEVELEDLLLLRRTNASAEALEGKQEGLGDEAFEGIQEGLGDDAAERKKKCNTFR